MGCNTSSASEKFHKKSRQYKPSAIKYYLLMDKNEQIINISTALKVAYTCNPKIKHSFIKNITKNLSFSIDNILINCGDYDFSNFLLYFAFIELCEDQKNVIKRICIKNDINKLTIMHGHKNGPLSRLCIHEIYELMLQCYIEGSFSTGSFLKTKYNIPPINILELSFGINRVNPGNFDFNSNLITDNNIYYLPVLWEDTSSKFKINVLKRLKENKMVISYNYFNDLYKKMKKNEFDGLVGLIKGTELRY